MVASASYNDAEAPLRRADAADQIDGQQLSELANQIAPVDQYHADDYAIMDPGIPPGHHLATVSCHSGRDDQEPHQQETPEFLAHFSKSSPARGSPKRHRIDSPVLIPLPGSPSQTPGNIFSMDKKAELQSHNDHASQEILEAVPGTSTRADLSHPGSSSFTSISGKLASASTEKGIHLEEGADLLNLNANVGSFLPGASMREREPKVEDAARDFLSDWGKGAAGSSVESDLNIGAKRKAHQLWGDSLSLKLDTEQAENVPDWPDWPGEGRERLSSSSKFGKEVFRHTLVHPRTEPVSDARFTNRSEDGNESRNTGLSPAHLSMMRRLFRSENIAGSSHHDGRIIFDNTKGKRRGRRLVLDQDLFKGSDEFQEQRKYMAEILGSIPKPDEGRCYGMLSTEQLQEAATKMNHTHPKLKSSLTYQLMMKMSGYKSVWHQYWQEEDGMDFSDLKDYPMLKNFEFDQNVLHIYLILVHEVLLILPFKKDQPLDQGLDYSQEMRTAFQAYLDFKRMIDDRRLNKEPLNDTTSELLKEMVDSVLCSLKHTTKNSSIIIWRFVEFWMQRDYPDVWVFLKDFKGKALCGNIKSIFNGIFKYGIENLTHQIHLD
ncbi:hypothetical protein PCANC_01249 [Puccinia coronata f. sp. avenae]|uniref:Uncharacterized protein n=1 Tax=Puccinia coronata f. sp. avenae TaxID=200324 RepID=A0A2N5V2K5_9BASI|nr:hypothetical protein PCASD_03829 [Puccinia coronata f. sp. avenae]PLW56925.1 hypothetical protein PCANC_01249 [Puccinia coronata f. sp. avenae]